MTIYVAVGAKDVNGESNSGSIWIVDATTSTLTYRIDLAGAATTLALTPDGKRAYVGVRSGSRSGIDVIDLVNKTASPIATTPQQPLDVAVSADAQHVVAVFNDGDTGGLLAVETSSDKVAATIPIPGSVNRVTFAKDSLHLYISGSSGISVIDVASLMAIRTIPLGSIPWGIAVNPSGDRAYVTHQLDDSVSEVDLKSGKTVAVVDVGDGPQDLVLTRDGNFAYVVDNNSGTLSVVSVSRTPTND